MKNFRQKFNRFFYVVVEIFMCIKVPQVWMKEKIKNWYIILIYLFFKFFPFIEINNK